MKRRAFLVRVVGVTTAWPLAAFAQGVGLPVVGFLHVGTPKDRARLVEGFRNGLKEGGFVDGRDVTIEYRWAEGHYSRLQALATELVNSRVALIATGSTPAAIAAKAATSTIPVVFVAGGDPVRLGIVKSLGRPGGNVTGIANLASALDAKRVDVLRDLLPGVKSIAYLVNPKFPDMNALINQVQAASSARAIKLHVVNASSEGEIDTAFGAIKHARAGAILVSNDSFLNTRRAQLIALAERHRIPACYAFREFPDEGGLMSYGADLARAHHEQGLYAARILKGTKPADLPVVQSEKLELVLNYKTAKALGIVVSRDFLARIDELIE